MTCVTEQRAEGGPQCGPGRGAQVQGLPGDGKGRGLQGPRALGTQLSGSGWRGRRTCRRRGGTADSPGWRVERQRLCDRQEAGPTEACEHKSGPLGAEVEDRLSGGSTKSLLGGSSPAKVGAFLWVFLHQKSLPGRLAPGLQCVQSDPPGRGSFRVLTAGLQRLPLLQRPRCGASGCGSSRGRVLGRHWGWGWLRLSRRCAGAAGVLDSAGRGPLYLSGSWRRPLLGLTLSFLRCIRSSRAQIWLLFERYSKFILLKCHK